MIYVWGFNAFWLVVVCLELYTGFAWLGWNGDDMVIDRRKFPGPYWMTMTVHSFILIGLPILATAVRVSQS